MKYIYYIAATLLALLSGVAVLLICHHGAGLESDTISYFRFPTTGELSDLPVHHGILYPIVLRLLVLAGAHLSSAAVLVNMFCAAATSATLFTLLLSVLPRTSLVSTSMATFLVSMSLPVLIAHSSAMSEPLFLMLITIGILYLIRALQHHSTIMLFISAAAFALSSLTRYAGLSLVGAGCLSILLFLNDKPLRRLVTAAVYGAIGSFPLFALLILNKRKAGSATNRELVYHGLPADTLNEGASTIFSWFFPERIYIAFPISAYVVTTTVMVVLIFSFILAVRSKRAKIGVLSLCTICYSLFLALSISLFDVSIMLSQRMLSPMALIMFPLLGVITVSINNSTASRIAVALAVAYMTSFTAYRAAGYVSKTFTTGTGYSSAAWSQSPLIKLIETVQNDYRFYSNAADAFYLRNTATTVAGIPWKQRSTSNRELESFTMAYSAMKSSFDNQCTFLASVKLRYWPPYLASEESIVEDNHLFTLISSRDGTIYISTNNACVNSVITKAEQINAAYGESVLRIHRR